MPEQGTSNQEGDVPDLPYEEYRGDEVFESMVRMAMRGELGASYNTAKSKEIPNLTQRYQRAGKRAGLLTAQELELAGIE